MKINSIKAKIRRRAARPGRPKKETPGTEPALEPLPLEADGETYDAEADLARRELFELVEKAVGNGFNLVRAIASEVGEPIWKVSFALEDLETAGRVQRVETATFSAFFPPGPVSPGRPVLNGEGGVDFGGCPECLREEDERLVFANPWRYPSRGELPEKRGFYLVTTDFNTVEQFLWDQGAFFVLPVELMSVRAWRELPDPAPELEEEQ